ncbi:NYN domain-containing protein [Brevibacillus choshinensis]|uniref:NYN domain-containing protein n=1 Tax=Brevibacillus choshinensis TaxID=54911 RepID=UPI002E20C8BC|nr:NYN domain-containing protein [Brevibacillus choshinensis]MED4779472.1 NYN domain-containing protein [Brevibacillus choshinensis]
MKAAVLIDEMNAISQLHRLQIEGIRSWRTFFEAVNQLLTTKYEDIEASYHFYGAMPPRKLDLTRFYNRKRFFEALERDDITVFRGYSHEENGVLIEKGVDVALSLDLFRFSLQHYDLLLVFSADGDLLPAVQSAQEHGAKIGMIVSRQQPARILKNKVDFLVPLEMILNKIPGEDLLVRRNINHHNQRERLA